MNLLRRFGQGCFDGLNLLRRCRPSNGIWPADLVKSSPAAAAATGKDSRWVMLNRFMCPMDDSVVADAKTTAESETSTGRRLRVSLGLAPPPSSSFLYFDRAANPAAAGEVDGYPTVIAAHGDSVLFEMSHRSAGFDYFVYRAGSAGRRPPSLSLLPACSVPTDHGMRSIMLHETNTSLLPRGEDDELLVALLDYPGRHGAAADVRLLRLGRREWELKPAAPIVRDEDGRKGYQQFACHGGSTVVPVGDRFLCWGRYEDGVVVCDMADEERPAFRYTPLPLVPPGWNDYYEEGNRPPIDCSRSLSGAGDGGALRFVSVDLRCCCGGFGLTTCEHSRTAFMVTTWTLSLTTTTTTDPLTWVKDTVLHCEELWALPGYEGLPRVHPEWPLLSLDSPDVVYFIVREDDFVSLRERKVWMVEVDTRRKKLLSAVPCTTDAQKNQPHLPLKLHY